MQAYDFTWIFALTVCFSFLDAFSIGANDVANSFATSVGSRSLKLWQAVCIAIFTEAIGAIALGASTTDTIKNGIISTTKFQNHPELLMEGYMCALIASSSFVTYATYLGWPVSTTHSIVGALAGIGISAFGVNAVKWDWSGMGKIIASWFISPVVSALIASIIYLITKFSVFRSKNSLRSGIYAIPIYFAFTLSVMAFYILLKNGKYKIVSVNFDFTTGVYSVSGDWAVTMGAIAAIFVGILIIGYGLITPFFIRLLEKEENLRWFHVFYIWFVPTQPQNVNISKNLRAQFTPDEIDNMATAEDGEYVTEKKDVSGIVGGNTITAVTDDADNHMDKTVTEVASGFVGKIKALLHNSLFMDVASVQSRNAQEAHSVAVRYDNKTEYLYSFLQVCTASFASFAHGSNDVANAVGPLAATYQIWTTGKNITTSSVGVPIWILIIGAIGIDVGLALYGYNIMKNLGNNLTYHSPSRGFSMELGAALTVITASFLGLPVSTTHCITGATVGVGLCNGSLKSINWRMFAWCFFGWIITVPVAGTLAGCLYALLTRGGSFSYGV